MVASGIVSVRFDCIRFDDNFGWCAPADEFHDAREKLLQNYVTELTRFTYCWAALECAIETIAPPHAPRSGKINDACFYIKSHSPNDKGFLHFWDMLADFRQILVNSGEHSVLNRFTLPSFASFRSAAIYVIYKIRNNFVHGKLYFPLPDSNNQPKSDYVQLVHLASGLTLISIQHLLAAAHTGYVKTWESNHDELEHEFHAFLALLHIKKRYDGDDGRLNLT